MPTPVVSLPACRVALATLGLAVAANPGWARSGVEVRALSCEYQAQPLGVQATAPALSWQLAAGSRRNVHQRAYRVRVAERATDLGHAANLCWDSGQVPGAQSLQVPYAGRPLRAGQRYYWQVRVWDERGAASPWSAVAEWQMGLLTPADWVGARWIGYEALSPERVVTLPVDGRKDIYTDNNVQPLLRREFTVAKKLRRATLYISGLGQFEAELNGQKVGDHFLDPGWTKYDREAQYVTFDVTRQLRRGANALGVWLGNGFYYVPPVKERYRKLKTAFGYPKLICRLALDYADGSHADVVSDESWRTTPGPVTFSSIYGGEDYNATLEQPGWSKPGFAAGPAWRPALAVAGPPELRAQQQEPLRVLARFHPRASKPGAAGRWVYDLGQNASGIVELRVRGQRGDTLRLTPAELLGADGAVSQKNSGRPYYFTYVLRGGGEEVWRPRFSYYGFRYVQLAGGVPAGQLNPSERPVVLGLTGLHTRNAAASTGEFACSDTLFNRVNTLIDWGVRSNLASVLTDCPHREKLGWLEQTHLMGNSLRYGYDVATLCRKTLADMRASQTPDGLVPEIAPEFVKFEWGGDMFRDSPEWGSASIILPWYMYGWYADRQALADSYPLMQRYAAYLAGKAQGYILSQGLGDWYDLGPKPPGTSQLTPMGVTGTATYYYDLTILAQVAQLLGHPADAAEYEQRAAAVKTAFNAHFYHPDTHQYATGSQTANAMALYMRLAPEADRPAVLANLVRDIEAHGNALTAGDIGFRYVVQALAEAGRSDVLFAMNHRTDVPGYGYQLTHGATALTESWAALPTVSNNHLMLGHLQEWLYGNLAGIRPAVGSVAFNKIDIRPEPVGDVRSARASHQSPYGLIASDWRRQDGTFELAVTIPANTTATIYLPATPASTILEGGQPLGQHPELTLLGHEQGRARVQVGSGTYRFQVTTTATATK